MSRNPSLDQDAPGKKLTGGKVLAIFLGFFGLVFLANGLMTYFALDTFDGVETEDAYLKGRDYNRTLEAAKAQAALGWTLTAEAKIIENKLPLAVEVRVEAADKDGAALAGLDIVAELWRPSHDGIDQSQAMREVAPGAYRAEIAAQEPGLWELRLKAKDRAGHSFKQVRNIVLRTE